MRAQAVYARRPMSGKTKGRPEGRPRARGLDRADGSTATSAASRAAAILGALGGAAGTGASKRREGVDYTDLGASGGKSAWASMTAEQRSEEMKRRAKVRKEARAKR